MIIDANMYWIPEELFHNEKLREEFLLSAPKAYGTNAYEKAIEGTQKKQIVIERPEGYQSLNYVEGEYLLETQLKDMDLAGVDQAILKTPGCQEWLTLELCKKFNDGMAKHTRKSGGRLHALAVIPPWGTKACLYELERCTKELGMKGVQLSAHYGNLHLDDETFRPFLQKLNDLKLPAYVHHTPVPIQYDQIYKYNNLRRSLGRSFDQLTAVGREIFSDMFRELPDLKLVHSMLGGGFFTYVNQLLPPQETKKEAVGRFQTDNSHFRSYLKHNIFFEMSHAQPWGKEQLEAAIKILGADHVIFGSSYPVKAQWLVDGADFVKDLNISEEEKALVLGATAKNIYGI